jgi:hypothetical protein
MFVGDLTFSFGGIGLLVGGVLGGAIGNEYSREPWDRLRGAPPDARLPPSLRSVAPEDPARRAAAIDVLAVSK